MLIPRLQVIASSWDNLCCVGGLKDQL